MTAQRTGHGRLFQNSIQKILFSRASSFQETEVTRMHFSAVLWLLKIRLTLLFQLTQTFRTISTPLMKWWQSTRTVAMLYTVFVLKEKQTPSSRDLQLKDSTKFLIIWVLRLFLTTLISDLWAREHSTLFHYIRKQTYSCAVWFRWSALSLILLHMSVPKDLQVKVNIR